MKILVLGGTRFIGPRVLRRLVGGGHDVTVFHRGEHNSALPAEVHSIRHPDAAMPIVRIPDCLRELAPDIVLHMVATGQADSAAARDAFAGVSGRMVVISSGDVYRAYGVFKRMEDGPEESGSLTEASPLRSVLFPYRTQFPLDPIYRDYDKVLVEREIAADSRLPATILRLPKVYGAEDNGDLGTVYGFRGHPKWRWTHAYVENVGAAIALATADSRAAGKTYNVGEEVTPTVAERLSFLPDRPPIPQLLPEANFAQDIAFDTTRIRQDLGFQEEVAERDAMRQVAETTFQLATRK
jgi:nucleoside-diphosphate-sugar epimerase